MKTNGTPLQYSCLENPMDGGVWKAAVHGVAEGRTRLSDFTFTFHFHALEKEMATHSSVLAWRIPGTGGAWWSAVYGVAQSRTRLKWLSSSSSSENQLLPSMIYYSVLFFQFIPQKSLDIDKRMKHWISYDPKPYYSCQFFILFEAFLTSYFFGY